MKRANTPVGEKKVEGKGSKKKHEIKFNLTPGSLACFKGKSSKIGAKLSIQAKRETKGGKEGKPSLKNPSTHPRKVPTTNEGQKQRSVSTIDPGTFHEQVVFMQYDDLDVYIDKCARQKSKSPSPTTKNLCDDNEAEQDQFVQSCVRVITEETDHTSEPYSLSNTPTLTPKSAETWNMSYYDNYSYAVKGSTRNRRSITTEESRAFVIDFKKIQTDGRTTIMVKNIPNKYTQETLLQEFSNNHENTFDFFYLPIDKDNQCNVGYAFVNFMSTKFISMFYQEFHGKKWKRYNSQKICSLCYARYQGTLELANHFRHTKILQQKDRKLRPLIGLQEANKIKQLEEIVRNQRNKE